MTNTEAKKILESYIACESKKAHFKCSEYNCDDSCPLLYEMGTVGEFNEAINMGIKALEQEPCEDAISRQVVLDTISELNAISFYEAQEDSRETYYEIRQAIKDLSPVKQEPKTGHWIEQIDHEENCRTLICSNCDRPALHDGDSIWKHKFCPHCGAKMESEKSER